MLYTVITLTQPWATLVALGLKRIETRGWGTKYRGQLLIHAADSLSPVGGTAGLFRLCSVEPFASALRVFHPQAPVYPEVFLPRGAIVASRDLVGCYATDLLAEQGGALERDRWYPLTDQERAFGDYTPDRFGWLLDGDKPLTTPIPARGYQRLWKWEGVLNA